MRPVHLKRYSRTLVMILGAMPGLSASVAYAAAREAPLALRCVEFAGAVLPPELIALPTAGVQIESAAMVAATAPGNQQGGEYCRITGRIKGLKASTPDIRFDLNLPRRWNGRALQIGGGGYNGVVVSGTGVMPFSRIAHRSRKAMQPSATTRGMWAIRRSRFSASSMKR
jgi:Tannase and feruloyl esterase.